MLTRLKINGFKNLVDVDVRFGPFTCIAGANGVGKSNMFDAIRFLAALSDTTLLNAAFSVRAEEGKSPDIRGLFHRAGKSHSERMRFEVEMIVPPEAIDDFGKKGTAKITSLRYLLELAYRKQEPSMMTTLGGELEIVREELTHIQKGAATKHFLFPHTLQWRDSAITGACRSPLISTVGGEGGRTLIKLHQDGNRGRPSLHPADNLPRTVLSSGNASESPTVLCARREMSSWKFLQLEPSALRKPSDFISPTQIGTDGLNLPSTLYHLARLAPELGIAADEDAAYCQIANRLSELIGSVGSIRVDRDEKRELFTLMLKELNGTELPARALSDGTLRFLALAVLEMDGRSGEVLCLEEPENGIHPERIPAIIRLLQDISSDATDTIDPTNPLRQVIVNTHSPAVVSEVPDDSLLVAELEESVIGNEKISQARFSCLPDTWRMDAMGKPNVIARGKLLSYLNPNAISYDGKREGGAAREGAVKRRRKVRERDDLQLLLPMECEQ
ncbi:MAG: AAA family ATPase [Pseudomonadota bacterium]